MSVLKNIARALFLIFFLLFMSSLILLASFWKNKSVKPVSMNKLVPALAEVLPEYNNDPLRDAFRVQERIIYPSYIASLYETETGIPLESYDVSGFAFLQRGKGTHGRFLLLIGINPGGKLTGVTMLEHDEPLGIGEVFSRQRVFFNSFQGKKFEELELSINGGGIQHVTGALYLSQAVVDAVRDCMGFFSRYRQDILSRIPKILAELDRQTIPLERETIRRAASLETLASELRLVSP